MRDDSRHWIDIAMFVAMFGLTVSLMWWLNGEEPHESVITFAAILCIGFVILRAIRERSSHD